MAQQSADQMNRQLLESMEELEKSSLLWGGNGEYLEELYEQYLAGNNNLPEKWYTYFDNLKSISNTQSPEFAHEPIRNYFKNLAKSQLVPETSNTVASSGEIGHYKKQVSVTNLINSYRRFGHTRSNLDPLGLTQNEDVELLNLEYHGLTQQDLQIEFETDSLFQTGKQKLQTIITTLNNIYCGSIGFQYQYINTIEELKWLERNIEARHGGGIAFNYNSDTKKNTLKALTVAEGLEKYLHTKYVGQKRFSLEGGESLIVIMDELIQRSGSQAYKEMIIAMAHRGRLNVLVNILGKSPAELFAEFEGKFNQDLASGDVKYHQGFSSEVKTAGGNLHLSLAFNPSHLEIVSPVAQGSVKARQDRRTDHDKKEVFLVSIHGDSAFAGQGVVMETFNMSQLRGFNVGGTVHIVINNQVGFTTSNPQDTRSTRYCTDVAKMLEVPVFHVNGDDPDAVLFVTQLAFDYKTKFKKDVVIDLVCYRRHGHNEADEPSATQPLMYQVIKKLATTRDLYAQKLISHNVITEQEDGNFIALYRKKLDHGEVVATNIINNEQTARGTQWHKYLTSEYIEPFDTSCSKQKLLEYGKQLSVVPDNLTLQAQVKKTIQAREKMSQGELALDWGYAEMLAYASLIDAGYSLRLCGQDSGRGTFAHRHAVLHDQITGQSYNPLEKIAKQVKIDKPLNCKVIDSYLSEEAVMAFEYGYSTTDPHTLTIWEAQFGDFANGAQVVIDQFISSGEHKWGRLSGLVLLLPHGYEGMGPEHSSARLERFLQLCADHNMQVCVPTTPAQVFHLLRRQMIRDYRKPLVVMSPKSLLRHKLATSSLDELAQGHFQLILPEVNENIKNNLVKKVILCSGKVYYDLITERDANQITDVTIIRLEQLYPFPSVELKDLLAKYPNAKQVVWCQEEPKNQGAWYCSQHNLQACLSDGQVLEFVGRDSSSAPAVGYYSLHIDQQNKLVKAAIY